MDWHPESSVTIEIKGAVIMISTRKHSAIARNGMVVAGHPLASAAGIEMLGRGGNAVDAAVATLIALSVVEPMMSSIFGGGFMLIHLPDGQCIALDNYAVAPKAARADMYEPLPPSAGLFNTVGSLNDVGHLAVGVPGSLAAYGQVVERYGRLDWATVCSPSIRLAAEGFPATPYLVDAIKTEAASMARFPDTAKVFLPGGKIPAVGAMIRRPEFAQTLSLIAAQGPRALYNGSIGEAVVADMERNNGLITMQDFADYRVEERIPVRGTYRGYEIVSMAPASSGGIALVQMLNLLEGFDIGRVGFGTAEGIHLLAEVMKRAYSDRYAYLGDPSVAGEPPVWLTEKSYADRLRAAIDPVRPDKTARSSESLLEGDCTTHVTVADGEGYVVSSTQTLNNRFGSRVTVPGTGMLLNNCMRLFDPRPGLPNSVGPQRRMLSSMTPTLVLKDGQPVLAVGTPGGTRIITAVLQALVNVIDHGMSLQQAVEAPRIHTGTVGDGLLMEPGFSKETLQVLLAAGHPVQQMARVAGGMHAICYQEGLIHGAACWRADGVAIGLSGGNAFMESGEGYSF